jgi:hypothetical protein
LAILDGRHEILGSQVSRKLMIFFHRLVPGHPFLIFCWISRIGIPLSVAGVEAELGQSGDDLVALE